MLKPAICFKDEIESALKEYFYTDDMMYYQGYYCYSRLLKVNTEEDRGIKEFAVVSKGKLIGYISYNMNLYTSSINGFCAWSFDRGNPIMGMELNNVMENLIKRFHRVEFRAVSGNPAVRGYDAFLQRHSDKGEKIILHDTFKDEQGNYHDDYIYEFISDM